MMDELDDCALEVGELEATFNKAATYLQGLAATLSNEKLLFFYARYKQVNDGPCETPRPGFFDFKGKQKWDAWKALQDMDRDDAMKEYIDGISDIDPDWLLKGPSESGPSVGSWVRVSTLASQDSEDENCSGKNDDNPFDWVKENNVDKVKTLNLEVLLEKDEENMTLLHWAADRGYPEMTRMLIENGIDVNIQDAEGQTALHYAAACGHGEVVKVLLSKGADLWVTDGDGLLPMDCAEEEIRELLKQ